MTFIFCFLLKLIIVPILAPNKFEERQVIAQNAPDTLLVVFWNIENFFEPDSPNRSKYWTRSRFYTKCDAIAKTILLISERYSRFPDIIGLAEVENRRVLKSLCSTTVLRKLGYKIVHFDSPDRRGIDCALLYRSPRLSLQSSRPIKICDSLGISLHTRDILLASFQNLSILVNHHPSKIGGKTERRQRAMNTMIELADSLQNINPVLAIGDFNDTLWENIQANPKDKAEPEPVTNSGTRTNLIDSIILIGYRTTLPPSNSNSSANFQPTGTIKYNGSWEKIDGYFAFGDIEVEERIFSHPSLLIEDRSFGGLKPRRTFVGPRYMAGISDHLPIVLKIVINH